MILDRRSVVGGLGAAMAASLLPGRVAFAADAPITTIGAIEVRVVSDGTLTVPLSFMLPATPRPDAEAQMSAHGLPPAGVPAQTNVSLVRTGNDLVLIDAGSGSNFQDTAGKLADNLEALGIDRAAITKVVFTHGHADHLWGAIDDFDDSERFPNATYVIAADEWDFWTDPDTPARVPDWLQGMARGSARVLKRIEAKLERKRPGDEVAPGLSYLATRGHTPGHMSVLVTGGRDQLIIGGDALSHVAISFDRPDWPFGSDFNRDDAVTTRHKLLDQLAGEHTPLIGFHLPWPGVGRVERRGTAYRFVAG